MTEPTPLPSSPFLHDIVSRGYLHQCTDLAALDRLLADAKNPVPAYIGFDCTARSLHVGSLVSIMLLRRLQQAGHKPIVLMGGATTRIGDPTGRDEQRKMLSEEEIARNKAGIASIFKQFLTFGDGPTDAVMVDNYDWLGGIKYLEFLRDYGTHFTINRMMTFESVKLRLDREQPMTFLEFNYMLLQAVDFLLLSRERGVRLQMGGSDQWGNIVNGVELTRRVDQREVFGLTTPLITLASGQKMGKSAQGAVWLNEEMLSSYEYYQFWRNTHDADVARFLRLFTELPLEEIERLEALEGAEINEAKKTLAFEATRLCRGKAAAEAAAEAARKTFEQGQIAEDLPTIEIPGERLDGAGVAVFELMREAGLATSNGEARRLIKGGGARLNDLPVREEFQAVTRADIGEAGVVKLSAGRKRHALVKPI